MKTEIEWRPITDRPKRSGSVLIAMNHNDINIVLMGHYNKKDDKFTETIYHGMGRTIYQFWGEVHHPEGDIFENMSNESDA